jgi:hypothetical protein
MDLAGRLIHEQPPLDAFLVELLLHYFILALVRFISSYPRTMDSLPYIDLPNDEEYESYALSLIQEEMDRRRPPPPPQQLAVPPASALPLRPTGDPLSEQKLAPLSDASSSLADHFAALSRARRNYESERLRQLTLSESEPEEWKMYNDTVLVKSAIAWQSHAAHQRSLVDDINHHRKIWQEQSLLPQLMTAERHYNELVQKNLQLRSAIRMERRTIEEITGASPL